MLITRGTSLSRVYATCYPVAVTSLTGSCNGSGSHADELESGNLEQERLAKLLNALNNTVIKQVLGRMAKILEVGEVLLSRNTATQILQELVYQGEREPYGVRGGILVVLFNDRFGKVHKMGRFPLDSSTTSTYHIHLTLSENRNFKVVWDNWVRKVTGVEPAILLSTSFTLEKKKLYRSSSSLASM